MLFKLCILFLVVLGTDSWPGHKQQQQQRHPNEPTEEGPSVLSTLPKELQEQMSEGARRELEFLTSKDVLVLKNIIQQLPKFSNPMQIRQVLKEHSPRLERIAEQKFFKMMGVVASKRSQLLPQTRDAFHQAGEMSKNYAKSIVEFVRGQDQSVRDNLDQTFPHFSYFLNSPLFQSLIQHIEH